MLQKQWEALRAGDIVDIVAPGGKPKPFVLEGVEGFLKNWGLKARMSSEIVGKDLLCSHSREQRWAQLKKALTAKDSKMIWCLRGGYGSLQLLEDLKKLRPQPAKIFLGFSDITSLHVFLNQHWGWSTLHGCHLDRFALGQGSAQEQKRIESVIFAKTWEVKFKLKGLNDAAKKETSLRSQIVGGNMITLQSSFGTTFQIDTRNKILFVEETGERAYKIDRILEHMRQLKLLKNLKALVFGQITESLEPNGRDIIPTYLKQFAKDQKFPVLSGLPSGHGKNQYPLPLNTPATLKMGASPLLTVKTGVKSF